MSLEALYQLIIGFVRDHWELITMIVWLIGLIILLIKRKITIKDAVSSIILKQLPSAVKIAEESVGSGNGELKKKLVFDAMIQLIRSLTDLSDKEIMARYGSMIDEGIENILACPAKKG